MDFEDFLGPDVEVLDLHAEDRWQAIEELINHLVATRKNFCSTQGRFM